MRETKDSGVDWIGEVPVNWEIVPIKADVSIGHGSDPTTPGDIPVWGSGGEPFKTCGEHKNGPAVLLGRKGTLDCPQLVTGLYWNVDTAFDAKITSKKLSLKFFYYAATCVDIKPYMTNTAKPSMTQFDWDNSRIPALHLRSSDESSHTSMSAARPSTRMSRSVAMSSGSSRNTRSHSLRMP